MADKKIVTPAEDSQMAKLNNAMIEYALALIEEIPKVNANEKHIISTARPLSISKTIDFFITLKRISNLNFENDRHVILNNI